MTIVAEEDATILVMAGESINEPAARLWTIRDEHASRTGVEAVNDYQAGKMGHLSMMLKKPASTLWHCIQTQRTPEGTPPGLHSSAALLDGLF